MKLTKGRVYILAEKKNRSVTKTDANASEKKPKWSKKKRIAAWIIGVAAAATFVVLALVIIFDLGPVVPISSTEEQAAVVGTVAGFEVRYEEIRYITSINKASMDIKYGKYDTLSQEQKQKYQAELYDLVMEDVKSNYAVLALCREFGVDIDSRDAEKFVNDSIKQLVNNEFGGKKSYKKWLEDNKLTDAFLRLMYKVSYLETQLIAELSERGEIKYNTENLKDFVDFMIEDDSYVKIIHAYYPRTDYDNGMSARENAEAALSEVKNAVTEKQRFNAMKSIIGRAPYVQGYSTMRKSDFYITYGQMHDDYEKLAFSLDEYQVSDVLELEEGCYILMRVPKDKEDIGARASEFLANYEYAVLKQLVDEQREKISFEGNDNFKALNLTEIK